MDRGEEPECRASDLFGGCFGNCAMFGGLNYPMVIPAATKAMPRINTSAPVTANNR
jgi:hypothetical protein